MRCTQWQHNMTVIEYKQQQKNDDFLPVLKDRDVVDERWWQDRNTTYELFCGSITTTSHLSMHCRCYLINVKVNVSPEQRHYNITPVYAGVIKLQLTIARLRLHASMISICLSVCLSPKCKKTRFSQKLSNLELRCLLTTYRKLCKLNWAFQRTRYWIPTIQDGWDTPSWKSTWRHFFLPSVVRFG